MLLLYVYIYIAAARGLLSKVQFFFELSTTHRVVYKALMVVLLEAHQMNQAQRSELFPLPTNQALLH